LEGRRPDMMTCEQYLEMLCNEGQMSEYVSEQYHSGGVNTDNLFDYMLKCAALDGVLLSDMNVWDYDKALYAVYETDSDKSLS
jgi:hypothetical protein